MGLGKTRLGFKCKKNAALFVEKAVDLDLDGFTRRTAVARAGSQEHACLLKRLGFDAPLLDPRDQHPGVEEAGFCLWRGRGGGSGRAQYCASCRHGLRHLRPNHRTCEF